MASRRPHPCNVWLAVVAAVVACATVAACGDTQQVSGPPTTSSSTAPPVLPSLPPPTTSQADLTTLLTQRFQGYLDAHVKATTMGRDDRLLLMRQWVTEKQLARLDQYYFEYAKEGKELVGAPTFTLYVIKENDPLSYFVAGCMDLRSSKEKIMQTGKVVPTDEKTKAAWLVLFSKEKDLWLVDGIDTSGNPKASTKCK